MPRHRWRCALAPDEPADPIAQLARLMNRLRPSASGPGTADAAANLRHEIARLGNHPAEAERLGAVLRHVLALPNQSGFFAESGVRSALGSWLELVERVGHRVLPPRRDDGRLRDVVHAVFQPGDHVWVASAGDAAWVQLARAVGMDDLQTWGSAADQARCNIFGAARMVSYRLAGASLDRELLRSDRALERDDSPFLAQNALLVPVLDRWRSALAPPRVDDVRAVGALLDQCDDALDRVRSNASERGISIRLTYHVAGLQQLIGRLRDLLAFAVADDPLTAGVRLMKSVLAAEQARHYFVEFVGENVSLIARNITEHASRRGEHYIAENRAAWWAMGKGAAGGGIVIAVMALIKVKLALLQLPPLTEGMVFGFNYALGFVVIHVLGLTVATKQPAMTAAAIAATLEGANTQGLEPLADLVQNVYRTQSIAVLGNVLLALPVAAILSAPWALKGDIPGRPKVWLAIACNISGSVT